MLLVEESIAPSLARLRPLRPEVMPGFPVYGDLVDRLVASADGADPAVMHALAVCAGYAYAGPDVVTMMMARMGMAPGSHGDFSVHAGFYRNVRATRFEVLAALQRAAAGESVVIDKGVESVAQPMQVLYLAGHSLGGAMASLLAIMLRTEERFATLAERMRVVATFGQPMVGTPELARACQRDPFLSSRVLRHVYRDDVVPHLPPRDTGAFEHFGVERRFDGQWSVTEPTRQMGNMVGMLEMPMSFLSRRIEILRRVPFRHSLDDHLPQHYISALTPPGVPSEFGDLPYTDEAAQR